MRQDMEGSDVGARIGQLERSLVRTRVLLFSMAVVASTFLLAGWRRSDDMKGEKLILTDAGGTEVLVLKGVWGDASPLLRLETPSGQEVLTLGPGIRRVR